MSPPVRLATAADLDRAAIERIARGARVELTDGLRNRIRERRAEVLAALADGRAVYGVNTGMGAQSGVRLSAAEQAAHQQNLLLARAVGGPPWLPSPAVRALLAVRLGNFLHGDAGVSVELIDALVRFIEAGVTPAVPRAGYGSAGEIIALAHAFGPLIGVGSLVDRTGRVFAANGLPAQGIEPLDLGPKEGIALLQGVPGTTALAALVAPSARRLVGQSITGVALGLSAIAGSRDTFAPGLARGDEELARIDARLLERLAPTPAAARTLQPPVSFRVAAVALAQVARAATALEAAIDRALGAVGDSPAFVDGSFSSSTGFYGLDLAAALDGLTVAVVHAAEVSVARTHRLLDGRFTGLADQLTTDPGPQTGLIAVHKRSAGVLHQLRRRATSSIVGTIETSFGQEDVQSFSWEAAANAACAVEEATDILAGELLVAAQALAISRTDVPPPLVAAVAAIHEVVPTITGDRPFGVDVEAVRARLGRDGPGDADGASDALDS